MINIGYLMRVELHDIERERHRLKEIIKVRGRGGKGRGGEEKERGEVRKGKGGEEK